MANKIKKSLQIESDKKRFVRALLKYLEDRKRLARTLGVLTKGPHAVPLHQAYENALHDVAQYVRQITKPRKIK